MAPFLSHPLNGDAALGLVELRHAPTLAALVESNKEHLRRWLSWVPDLYTEAEARSFIQSALRRFAGQNGLVLGIWVADALVGLIDLHPINSAERSSSLGYWLSEAQQGKGLVTAACRALLEYAFSELALERMEIRVATENTRSRAVPERLGFRFEGIHRRAEWLHDHFVDHAVYAMRAEEWLSAAKVAKEARGDRHDH